MPTLKDWIIEHAAGEPVDAVVIGERGWSDDDEATPAEKKKVILTWDEASPFLSYDFNDGFGAPDCHAIAAYTASWVIAVSQYDGSTSPFRIPRNPVAHDPVMPGG